MNLKHLTDKALLEDLRQLIADGRVITTKTLHHLNEVESRKLYSELKFTSLFDYCVRELKLSEASAHRRIEAARVMKILPVVENKINEGRLTLTNISKAAMFFKENGIKGENQKQEVLEKIESLSSRECERLLNSLSRIQSEKRIRINILERTYLDLLNVRSLLGRNASMDLLLDILIQNTKTKIEKDKFKQNSSVRKTPAPEAARVISSSIKRNVYQRDQKCVKCGSAHNLNFDHRIPYSLGGKSTEENIRLLCFNCNQRSRIVAKL